MHVEYFTVYFILRVYWEYVHTWYQYSYIKPNSSLLYEAVVVVVSLRLSEVDSRICRAGVFWPRISTWVWGIGSTLHTAGNAPSRAARGLHTPSISYWDYYRVPNILCLCVCGFFTLS